MMNSESNNKIQKEVSAGRAGRVDEVRPPQPTVVIPERADVPQAVAEVLPNGMKMYVVESSDQQVIRLSFVFRAGSSLQSVPFSASATVNLLSEGTNGLSAARIAEQLDFYGLWYDVSADRDYSVVTFCCLNKFLGQALELAREILLTPAFPAEELATYCAKQKQRLTVERSKVAFRARELFARTLFGAEHPYGVSTPGERYDDLNRDDLEAFYKRFYVAGNAFAVVSGDVDEASRKAIAELASAIPPGEPAGVDGFTVPVSARYAFDRQPGALQSAIRIGTRLFPRSHPDFIPMQVVTTVLGGYFGSRLVHNLREERGYTYGVFAAMVNFEFEGYLAIAAEVASDATQDAIDQIFYEMERLRTEDVPQEELQMVKNIVAGEVMRILDGPFGIADVTIENVQNGTGNDYINRFLSEVRAMTPESVREIARKYLIPERFTTVVIGDSDPAAAGKCWAGR